MARCKYSKMFILFFLLFLFMVPTSVFAVPDCSGLPPCVDDTECASPATCDSEDGNPEIMCCVDLTAVPELPSWFGPFFLATAVAGWEYLRQRRRKYAPIK